MVSLSHKEDSGSTWVHIGIRTGTHQGVKSFENSSQKKKKQKQIARENLSQSYLFLSCLFFLELAYNKAKIIRGTIKWHKESLRE